MQAHGINNYINQLNNPRVGIRYGRERPPRAINYYRAVPFAAAHVGVGYLGKLGIRKMTDWFNRPVQSSGRALRGSKRGRINLAGNASTPRITPRLIAPHPSSMAYIMRRRRRARPLRRRVRRSFRRSRVSFKRRGTKRMRRSRQGYRRKGMFSCDTWRHTFTPQFSQSITTNGNVANGSQFYPGASSFNAFVPNPIYMLDSLGAHGAFDLTNLVVANSAGAPAAQRAIANATPFGLISGGIARQFKYQANNVVHRMRVLRPRFNFRITPDWQAQGSAPLLTGATPVWGADAKMVVHFYTFTARRKVIASDLLGNTSGSLGYPGGIGTATSQSSDQLVANTDLSPVTATVIQGVGTDPIVGGLLNDWARGIEERIGTATPYDAASTGALTLLKPNPPTSQNNNAFINSGVIGGVGAASNRVMTIPSLLRDGVSIYDSSAIVKKWRIRRVSRVIAPNDSLNHSVRMPSYMLHTGALDITVPTATTNIAELANNAGGQCYLPAGFTAVVVRAQLLSNVSGSFSYPPVKFTPEVTYTQKTVVPGSKLHGNLFLGGTFTSGIAPFIQNLHSNVQRPPTDAGP